MCYTPHLEWDVEYYQPKFMLSRLYWLSYILHFLLNWNRVVIHHAAAASTQLESSISWKQSLNSIPVKIFMYTCNLQIYLYNVVIEYDFINDAFPAVIAFRFTVKSSQHTSWGKLARSWNLTAWNWYSPETISHYHSC